MLEVQQPLVNIDGIYGRKAAKSKMEAYELQHERTAEYMNWLIEKSYMQLQLTYKAVGVLEKADSTGKANLQLVENYAKQGMVQKTDLLRVKVHVNDVTNQLAHARTNLQNASDYIAYLLHEDMSGKTYQPSEELENTISKTVVEETIPQGRKDLMAYEKSTEAYKLMWQSGKMSLLPRLNAFGNYQWYDKNLFGTQANGYLVGAQLSWNVFDGYKSFGKINKAKADYEKANLEQEQYETQSNLELNSTIRQLSDAFNKEALSQVDMEQASEAYRILQNRYTQGLEKTTDLLQASTLLLQKELEHLQAVFEYNTTAQYIHFLTH
jgi:outer membrane protein TolC